MRYLRARTVVFVFCLLVLLLTPRRVLADVKFTVNVVTKAQAGSVERTVHMFVQGDQVRVEDGSATVLIYDAKGGRLYRLDTASKTYRVGSMAGEQGSVADRLAQPDRTKSSLKLKVESDTRAIEGLSAQRATVAARVESDHDTATPGGGLSNDGMRSTSQGQRPGFGIPVSVGSGGSGEPAGGDTVQAIQLDGEYWLAPDTAAVAGVVRNAQALRLLYAESLPREKLARRLLDSIVKAMNAEAVRFPLASRLTLRLTDADASVDAPQADRPTVVVTTAVTGLVEGALDRMLFIVPAEFRQGE